MYNQNVQKIMILDLGFNRRRETRWNQI